LPPVAAESLIGRDEALGRVAALLQEHRLVTVLGVAGVGKTAVARAVVRAGMAQASVERAPLFAWVELAPLTDPALLAGTIAHALQLPIAGPDLEAALVTAIRPLDVLLVLDNAEHLIEPLARLVPRLLASAPALRMLVTSQAPLKLDGECLFRLEPLACPPAGATLEEARAHGAVKLFMAQAQIAGSRLVLDESTVAAVIDICRRLDGVALAIKLAAARLPLLGLAGLHAGLTQSLKILGGGARDNVGRRHETLRAAFDWSHGLLASPEQAVFRRLGAFVGGFTLASACVVCGDESMDDVAVIEALAALVDRSFVVVEGGDPPRYHLLQTARDYALLQLERSGELPGISRRHAQAMLALLRHTYDRYFEEGDDSLYDALARDLDNVRAAIHWSIQHEATLAVRLAGEARMMFLTIGQTHESLALTQQIEPLVDETVPAETAGLFQRLRTLALQTVDQEQSAAAALKSVELLRAGGDARQRFGALLNASSTTSLPLETKEQLLVEARALMASGWPAHIKRNLSAAEATVAWQRGDRALALEGYRQVLAVEPAGRYRSNLLNWVASRELVMGLVEAAGTHAREAVALARERGPSNLLFSLQILAAVLIEQEQLEAARAVLGEIVSLSRRTGWHRISVSARRFVCLAAREGRSADAARLLGYLRGLGVGLDAGECPEEAHLQSFGESATGAALSPDELGRCMAEGARLDEPAVCALGLAAPAAAAG
jgi:predicted ATPase